MCNFYRRFVSRFALIESPLNFLLQKEAPDAFVLKEKQLERFENLKRKLAAPPVLALPQKDLPYILDTDAEANQIGCVLMQLHGDKSLKPIGYFSKTLTETECK